MHRHVFGTCATWHDVSELSFKLRTITQTSIAGSHAQGMNYSVSAVKPQAGTNYPKADNLLRWSWLPVTLLIRADDLCIGEYVPALLARSAISSRP
jgi:hypothetical protein